MARILLLDRADVVARLRGLLTALGHEVIASDTDAYAALGLVKSSNAELMMISLNLPGGGAQLIDRLRSEPPTARTPIIALFDENWTGVEQDAVTRLLQNSADADTLKLVLDELLPRGPAAEKAPAPSPAFDGEDSPPALSREKGPAPMDLGAPSDDDLPPGETIEL
jgi:CheY-like chemotaxis protein